MVVVDTNVLAYLLIDGDYSRQARELFLRDPDWRSEAFILVELSNLLATYVRSRALSRVQAEGVLVQAESHLRSVVSVPHRRALAVAAEHGISAYDARFVAAAQSLGGALVTEDAKLRAAVPGVTRSLAGALAP